ncbi:pogo transposable element with ZNF domain isoform X2 [Amia ocellicauda]|uniref:pogo transposable element with ZNF domain isoform X2 n=1 Tax=Amia ocellicauda TaxID=2972642 RepID=UPI0034648C2B
MADADLFMECEEEELEPWQQMNDDVEDEAVEETSVTDRKITAVSSGMPALVAAPPPPTLAPPPVGSRVTTSVSVPPLVVSNADAAKKTVVTLFTNTGSPVSSVVPPVAQIAAPPATPSLVSPAVPQAMPAQGQQLILTQSPGGLSTVTMPQMLQPMQVMPSAGPGGSGVTNQPFFITTQGFPVRNVRPGQNSVNPLGIVLNVQQGQTVRPITLVPDPEKSETVKVPSPERDESPRKRRRRCRTFQSWWKLEFDWIEASEQGLQQAYCTVCDCDFTVVGGMEDASRHGVSPQHRANLRTWYPEEGGAVANLAPKKIFQKLWKAEFDWLQSSKRGPEHAFCTACGLDFTVSTGLQSVKVHEATVGHRIKVLGQDEKESQDNGGRQVAFQKWWTASFDWLGESAKGRHHARCSVCSVDFYLEVGLRDARQHEATARHQENLKIFETKTLEALSAPGTQFFKPAVGVPQVLSQVTQVRPGTAVPGRPPTSTYTTVIPATLTIRTTAAPSHCQPGVKTVTTMSPTNATQLVQSSALSSPAQTISVPASKLVNVCNLVAVKRGEHNPEVQKLVNLVNTVSPSAVAQPPTLQVVMTNNKAPGNGLPTATTTSSGAAVSSLPLNSIQVGPATSVPSSKMCPRCGAQFRLVEALRGHMCFCCPELIKSLKASEGQKAANNSSANTVSRPAAPPALAQAAPPQTPPTPQPKPLPSASAPPSATPPADSQSGSIDSQGKLIMLVDDFYYGSDEGRLTHSLVDSKEPVPFKCLNCSKKLKNNIRFMNHMKHHVELDQQNGEVDTHTICQHCYRQFPTPFQLQCHLESVHSHYESTTKCKICEWAFESEPVFLQHMKNTHKPGEMPYVCQVCEFRSSYYSDVDAHFRVQHEDTKHLLCLYCLKVFKNGTAFQQHFFRHQKKSVYHCNKCRLQFLFTKDKIEHKLHHHKTYRKPRQLEGLKPGTKVTIRAYAVQSKAVGMSVVPPLPLLPQPAEGKSLPAKPAEPPFAPPAAQRPAVKKRSVSKMLELLSKFQEKRSTLGRQTCLECSFDIPDFPNHFPTYVHCSLCRYSTCCSRAYANHMINNHVPRKSPKYLALYKKPAPSWLTLACTTCSFTTKVGDVMAKHLDQNPNHGSSLCSGSRKAEIPRHLPLPSVWFPNSLGSSSVLGRLPRSATKLLPKPLPSPSPAPTVAPALNGGPRDVEMAPVEEPEEPPAPEAPSEEATPATAKKEETLSSTPKTKGPLEDSAAGPSEPEKPASETKDQEETLSVRQLRIALFALCCGVPQAAEHFGSPPELIEAWLRGLAEKERQRGTEGRGGAAVDRLVQWVLVQREQQLPVNEKNLFQKASEIHSKANLSGSFRISYEWAVGFMLRHELGLQTRGAVGRRLPPDMEENVRAFVEFVQKQIHVQEIPLSVIGTMDELSIFVDLEALGLPGTAGKEAAFQMAGTGESLFDLILTVLADGSLLPTLLFFKGQPPAPLPAGLPEALLLEAKPEGFTEEEEMEIWTSRVWQKHMDSQSGGKGMLVMDTFRTHMSDDSLAALSTANTLPAVIPAGCTSRIQPLEVCAGPVLRGFLRARWSAWVAQGVAEGAGAEDILQQLVGWVAEALAGISAQPELLQQSFLVASVLPGPEGVESAADTQVELIRLMEQRLQGPAVPAEEEGEAKEGKEHKEAKEGEKAEEGVAQEGKEGLANVAEEAKGGMVKEAKEGEEAKVGVAKTGEEVKEGEAAKTGKKPPAKVSAQVSEKPNKKASPGLSRAAAEAGPLHQLFEKDSDAESFHGFDDTELDP